MEDMLKAQGKTLKDVLFDDSSALIKGNAVCDEQAKANYIKAIELVSRWFMEGKCFFQYGDPEEKRSIHCIYIKWRFDNDYVVEMEAAQLREIFSCVNDGFIVDDKGEWQISTTIYRKA